MNIKKRGLVLVAFSMTLGIVAAIAANSWLQLRLAPDSDDGNQSELVVAASIDIPFGAKVEPRHLKTIDMPPGSAPPGAYESIDEVVGKVATHAVYSGEILVKNRFADHQTDSTLAAVVAENMRAVTVRVDDVVGVAGFLLPGNRVDVLASRKEKKRAITETILRNIKVLAVDQTAAVDKNDPVIVRAVTLEMTPRQAEVLVKGKEEGTIQLTLRNPLDDEVFVEQAAPAPKPARKAAVYRPPVRNVTVIRGTQVAQVKTKQSSD